MYEQSDSTKVSNASNYCTHFVTSILIPIDITDVSYTTDGRGLMNAVQGACRECRTYKDIR
jgi:hypothetical protein